MIDSHRDVGPAFQQRPHGSDQGDPWNLRPVADQKQDRRVVVSSDVTQHAGRPPELRGIALHRDTGHGT